jgi:iron uptake system component EfeO
MQRLSLRLPCAVALLLTACSSSSEPSTPTDDQFKQQITTGMQTSMLTDINDLLQASKDLQAAAPVTTGRGWDKTQDATAIASMKAAWIKARTAYEHTEGALAPIFPLTDISIDERYDGFLDLEVTAGVATDAYLFDDMGVTGLHAIERILYSDVISRDVIDFESHLTGYAPAAFPATEQEAADFKNKLGGKLIADAQLFKDGWTPQKIGLSDAFNGLIGLMNEQREKVNNAGAHSEESRYSQRTMADLRDNLAGTKKIYEVFQPWIITKTGAVDGKQTDAAIETGFAHLAIVYATVQGDAFPPPPATWDATSTTHTDAELATPFGTLYSEVLGQVDPAEMGSIVDEMNAAATLMGLMPFTE